jgi:hypothetical protein
MKNLIQQVEENRFTLLKTVPNLVNTLTELLENNYHQHPAVNDGLESAIFIDSENSTFWRTTNSSISFLTELVKNKYNEKIILLN